MVGKGIRTDIGDLNREIVKRDKRLPYRHRRKERIRRKGSSLQEKHRTARQVSLAGLMRKRKRFSRRMDEARHSEARHQRNRNMIWGSAKRRIISGMYSGWSQALFLFPVSCPRYGTAHNGKATCHKNVTGAVQNETEYRT